MHHIDACIHRPAIGKGGERGKIVAVVSVDLHAFIGADNEIAVGIGNQRTHIVAGQRMAVALAVLVGGDLHSVISV